MSAARASDGGRSLELVAPAGDGAGELERLKTLVGTLSEQNRQLQTALDSRIVIEQAKGFLAGRFGVEIDDAFQLLRRAARNNRMSIHALAAAVVGTAAPPDGAA